MLTFIDNAAEVTKYAWSIKANVFGALLGAVAMSLPLWDPTMQWFSTSNIIAIGTFFANVGAGFLRLVDQGLAKKPEDPDGDIPLGI